MVGTAAKTAVAIRAMNLKLGIVVVVVLAVVEELAVKECGVEKSVGVESWKLEVLSFAG